MNATDDLRNEHRAVERMLSILGRMIERPLTAADVPVLDEVLDFLRVFVDACHHRKEEELLFKALLGEDVEGAHEQVDPLLAEHEQGRALVSALAADLERARGGEVAAFTGMAGTIAEYIELLRSHIASEETGVFTLADVGIPDPLQDELIVAYEDIEATVIGEGRHEAFHALLDRLEES